MNTLLEKEDFRKLSIFYSLESSHLQAISLAQLEKKLNLSTFLVVKSVKELILDIEEFDMNKFFNITIDNNIVNLKRYGGDSVDRLVWRYLISSKKFQLLTYLFQNDSFTLEKFATTYFISMTKTYSIKATLDSYLSKHYIKLNNSHHFSGKESTIRIFFYQVYFSAYRNYDCPFSTDIMDSVNHAQKNISSFSNSISHTQKVKLHYFLSVLFQRLKYGNTIGKTYNESTHFAITEHKELIQSLKQNFSDNPHLSLNNQEILNEVDFLIHFLIAEEIISINWDTFLKKNSLEKEAGLAFVQMLHEGFPHFKDLKIENILLRKLDAIHFRCHFLNDVVNHYNPFDYTELLSDNYSQFYNFSKDFVYSIIEPHIHSENKSFMINHLLSQYVFLLIEYFPTEWFLDRTVITVDFSDGDTYNHLIKKNINALPFYNVEVNYQLTSRTDILLSDLVPTDIHCKHIIWNRPPLNCDWEVLGSMIVAIKKKRIHDTKIQQKNKPF